MLGTVIERLSGETCYDQVRKGVLDPGLPGRFTLIALANMDPPAAEDIAREFRGWLGVPGD